MIKISSNYLTLFLSLFALEFWGEKPA